jgi:hypothetical protein
MERLYCRIGPVSGSFGGKPVDDNSGQETPETYDRDDHPHVRGRRPHGDLLHRLALEGHLIIKHGPHEEPDPEFEPLEEEPGAETGDYSDYNGDCQGFFK